MKTTIKKCQGRLTFLFLYFGVVGGFSFYILSRVFTVQLSVVGKMVMISRFAF